MASIFFPDNSVLCSFASVDELDLLEGHLRGRGRWTEAIVVEVEASFSREEGLRSLVERKWLGEPVRVDTVEAAQEVEFIRRTVFRGKQPGPDQWRRHLGESETIYVIQHRSEYRSAFWVSEDRKSLQYATSIGIHTRETIDMVRGIVEDGTLTAQEGFRLMQRMREAGRGMRMPNSPEDFA
ncbi:MAG: hypothetical protein Q4G51_02165 [Dermatophilus congolensis]|nr:hypothetical protein [Dermatophilus congolensis]